MANKPATRNWNDIQVAIATVSMALTLVFWNLFAGPDRELSAKRALEQAAQGQAKQGQETAQAQSAPVLVPPTAPQLNGPILFGGSAPQTIVQSRGGGGGGGGGTGGS